MDNPSITDVISLIMENPDLVEKIKTLTKPKDENSPTISGPKSDGSEDASPVSQKASEAKRSGDSERRKHLLSALKPYLNENRQKAIDSIMSFSEIFDIIKGG